MLGDPASFWWSVVCLSRDIEIIISWGALVFRRDKEEGWRSDVRLCDLSAEGGSERERRKSEWKPDPLPGDPPAEEASLSNDLDLGR
jgi:hypothetical protein